MIAYARAIAHGKAMTQYATKNCRADLVKVNLLSEGLPYMGLWEEMCLHMERFASMHSRKPIKNTTFDIEVSPTEKESAGWTLDDWRRYTEEFVAQLDSMTEGVDRNGKRKKGLTPTNIANSQYFAALHHDSKSGIPHLHIIVNRIDRNGNTNKSEYIGERASLAAQIINERHGWGDTMEIRARHIKQINSDVWQILREMKSFSWQEYFDRLRAKGYEVYRPKSKDGDYDENVVHGYSILMGNSHYRSSDLGKGRCFTAAKIKDTFANLHPELKVSLPSHPIVSQYVNLKAQNPDALLLFRAGSHYEAYMDDAIMMADVLGVDLMTSGRYGDNSGSPLKYAFFDERDFANKIELLTNAGIRVAVCEHHSRQNKPTRSHSNVSSSLGSACRFKATWRIGGKDYPVDIPMTDYNNIKENTLVPDDCEATHDDIIKVGVLLFLGYVDAATTVAESYGGGGSTSDDWGKKKDDDDELWARRCAAQANRLCKPMARGRSKSSIKPR